MDAGPPPLPPPPMPPGAPWPGYPPYPPPGIPYWPGAPPVRQDSDRVLRLLGLAVVILVALPIVAAVIFVLVSGF